MSLTIAKAEGVTVFTVTSDPKSRCPLICQLLGTMCCCPVCSVSQNLKKQLGNINTALGAVQILFGLMNVAVGCIYQPLETEIWSEPFWLGAVFIAAGITCIFTDRFPSPCLVIYMVLLNLVSSALAVYDIVLYSLDLAQIDYKYSCSSYYYYQEGTPPPQTMNCENFQHFLKMLQGGVDIMMIVLGVVLLCGIITRIVLSLKALCKKNKGDKVDPELCKPLVEEVLSCPEC
ncbi:uncharacterized protein [Hoplias malabaricus]|uniref:uncharacterized protein n=1 Tax=Hoplias malabaricus TaxID=27720 RepID=UPI003462087D